MKNLYFLLIVAAVVIFSCQPQPKKIDPAASKAAINQSLENMYNTMNARDVKSYLAMLTEDALVCGTDPGEFWSKSEITNSFTQMVADTTVKMKFKVNKREIRVSTDGAHAVVIEQLMADFICPKIPLRRVLHFTHSNENWLIDADIISLTPLNQDIPKLNKALE